jgi:triacylglycerol esterase/lipase EstA (alpha/beta hydrolase family)
MTVARLLQGITLVLLLALLLALLAGVAAQAWWLLPAVLGLALLHAPLMALELVLQRRASRGDPTPAPRAGELLRAWAAEAAGALRLFGWHMAWRRGRFPDHLPADAGGRRGLILVHGFACNRGVWNPWWPPLRARGVPCIALDLEPVLGSIDAHAPRLEAAVQRLTAATGLPPLLVAHSMGGLAVRAWLRASGGDARVLGVVTIGTPHRGTWLARFGLSANTRQMRLHSPWLQALAAHEAQHAPARYGRFTCFYGHCDNIVFPCATATLPGADNRHLRAHAHLHLLRHPAVLAEVLRRLWQHAA